MPKKSPAAKKSVPKTKKEKDPNAPKRPLTAYFLFCADHRKKVQEENKDLKVTEISKKLSELWNKLTDAEKKKYQDLHAKNKAKYDKEMEAYNKNKDQ